MRDLILKMSLTADGFVCGPNDEIDWIFATSDAEARAWTLATISDAGAHLMGSRTFQDMASFWPSSTESFAAPMNDIPKVVFTSKGAIVPQRKTTAGFDDATAARAARGEAPLAPADLGNWTTPRVMSDDLATEIARLKAELGKPLVAHGGALFAQSLVRLGLVDEYRLAVHPIAIGRGKGLFATIEAPRKLQLVETKSFPGGTVAKIYRPK
jgi:dihydrofolate reductase